MRLVMLIYVMGCIEDQMKDKLKGELEDETMTEKEKLKLITEDMWCNKYGMECEEVPYEITVDFCGLGFSNYECDLLCRECKYMEEI